MGKILYNGPPPQLKQEKDYWMLLVEGKREREREREREVEKCFLKTRCFWKGGKGRDQQQSLASWAGWGFRVLPFRRYLRLR